MSTVTIPALTPQKPLSNAASGLKWSIIRLQNVASCCCQDGVVERSFAWAARFRRLARNYERLDANLKDFHDIAFASLITTRLLNTALAST